MNRYKKLVSNSIIFTIGNFGSKIISFILVPLYTFYLSTSEFGTADLVMTTATMLLPLVSLSISQAVLRFAMDDSEPVDQVLTNALIVLLKGLFVSSLILVILLFFNLPTNILVYTFATLGINAIQNVLAEYTRAIGKVKNYAVNGIVQTLVLGLSNIILIVKFNYGIDGYLVSILISSMISILYLSLRIRVCEHINYSHFDKTLTKRMLKFSIPLIPNNFMWWLINASNRYFIIFYRGVAENGLFSVANKVPSLLLIFTTIFSQSWQLSAIDEYKSSDRSKFYTEIYRIYFATLLVGSSLMLAVVKFVVQQFFAPAYHSTWQQIPFLLLSVVFSSLSGFLGTNYVASKNTKGSFTTSLVGAVIALFGNYLLIPRLGGIGASISIALSFAVVWVVRLIDTKKYVVIQVDRMRTITSLGILGIQILLMFAMTNSALEVVLHIFLNFVLIFVHKNELKRIVSPIIRKLSSRALR